jgi:aminomethyltransferase
LAVTPTPAAIRTALYSSHFALKARLVPFAGWEMPLQYSSMLAEARAVRSGAGAFDVSHMGRLLITGTDAASFLNVVFTGEAAGLPTGRARYGFLLNEQGGIIDDVVVYRLGQERYLLICNAANREEVVAWLPRWASNYPSITVEDVTMGTVLIAVQGPNAAQVLDALSSISPYSLRRFGVAEPEIISSPGLISRTGYTGEDGFEVMVGAGQGLGLWERLLESNVTPCGLGARDILRLEAGLSLHGNDITPYTTPLEAGLERFVKFEKDGFVGREALLLQQKAGVKWQLVGFRMQDRGIPRCGYRILSAGSSHVEVGKVTSGGHSPTLDADIGMGYIMAGSMGLGTELAIEMRERFLFAEVVPLPFYSRKREGV